MTHLFTFAGHTYSLADITSISDIFEDGKEFAYFYINFADSEIRIGNTNNAKRTTISCSYAENPRKTIEGRREAILKAWSEFKSTIPSL